MVKSFKSWNSVNEGLFTPKKAKGSQVLRSASGVRQKVSYVAKDNNNFTIRLIRMNDILSGGKITQDGAVSITDYINSQLGLVNAIGKIDANFFKTKFILYVIKKDTKRQEKIHFTIAKDSEYPEIPVDTQFISGEEASALLVTYNSKNSGNTGTVDVLINNAEEIVATTTVDDATEETKNETTKDDGKGAPIADDHFGKVFIYQMRTNMKIYNMKFIEADGGGAIEATVKGEKAPNGTVSWESPKIMWITDLDNAAVENEYSKWVDEAAPLYVDQEIINNIDVEYLTKMFSDKEFREDELNKYSVEYGGSEISVENIRNLLYYRDDSKIFPEIKVAPAAPDAATTTANVIPSNQEIYYPNTRYF